MFVLWQSLVVGAYRSFFGHVAQETGCRMALAAPASFRELAQQEVVCAPFQPPFRPGDPSHACFVLDVVRPHVQAVWFLGLGRALRAFFGPRPAGGGDAVFLCVAEPYSVTALLAWLTARAVLGRHFTFLCYAAQNIDKHLPRPLAAIQRFLFKRCASILVVGAAQEGVLRRHGYAGRVTPFPLWFDSTRFKATPASAVRQVVLGYAGGLTEAKGILDLLACCEQRATSWRDACALRIAGGGPLAAQVAAGCARLQAMGLDALLLGALAADDMPQFYGKIDVLVVPSRTTPAWKEQFGRVIVEARACGVVVLGSDSGEIPVVVGAADRVFREGDAGDLARVVGPWLERLRDPAQRAEVRRQESARGFAEYSDASLARSFGAALEAVVALARPAVSNTNFA